MSGSSRKQCCRRLFSDRCLKSALWGIFVFVILAILAPWLLTRSWAEFGFMETGQIGDTIGGIAGPIIAVLAAGLTFLAFWVQYKANNTQRRQLRIQTRQFKKQDRDTKIERFENKFYELLRLHRENISEMNIADKVRGRKAFVSMFKEFKFAYHVLEHVYEKQNISQPSKKELGEGELVNIAYIVFFMGVGETSDKMTQELTKKYNEELIKSYIDELKRYQREYNDRLKRYQCECSEERKIETNVGDETFTLDLKYYPFDGHMSRLGHYFRHLFQTVKFVADYDSTIIQNKYEYLRTLRAQLSVHEQLLLYYNGLTKLGEDWIEEGYFTKYRMIKNLPLPLADFGVEPKEKLGGRNDRSELLFEWDEIFN